MLAFINCTVISQAKHFVVHSVNGGVGYDGYENKIGKINYIACKQ